MQIQLSWIQIELNWDSESPRACLLALDWFSVSVMAFILIVILRLLALKQNCDIPATGPK